MPLLIFALWSASLLLVAPLALAQHQFDSWTTENGLPQNSVNDILQTRDGYLWLATFGGLVRFDGVRFVVFDRVTHGIESQRVRALHEDRQGTLWAATEDGMVIRYRSGRFTTYAKKDGLPHAVAVRIEEDDEGNLWITWTGNVTKYDGRRFLNFGADHFADRVAAPPEARYTETWWRQNSMGLHALVKGQVRTYSVRSELMSAHVTGVSSDRRDNLWIRTRGAGVIKASGRGLERYTTRNGLPSDDPDGAFFEAHTGDIWFHDVQGNLYRIRNGNHESIKVPGAPQSGVKSIYIDREGSTWIGTTASGLYRLREPAIITYTDPPSLIVYSILQDSTGAIWIGNGGLKRYVDGHFTTYWVAAGISPDRITSIYEDKTGVLWVGTYGGLMYSANGRFRRDEAQSTFLKGAIWAIHEDRSGTFWFATDIGLVRSNGTAVTTFTTTNGLSHDRITALFEDRTGTLWIGTFQGLTRLKDGAFTTYTERDGFIGSWVRAFHEDNDGILWIGTYDGGLYRLKGDKLTRYTRSHGLHDNGVFQILEDDAGNLWMGSNRGIYRVSRRELNDFAEARVRSITSLALGVKDGLSTLECNGGRQPAGLKTADGRLWFPTMGGVAVVDPQAVRINTHQPPVVIEEFRRGGETIDFGGGVEISSNTNHFEIRYTAPSFVKPERVRFRYRLVGLDDGWIEADDRRVASFHGIPAGQYQFVVIAANSDGVWNTTGASVNIVVLPPIWSTWWFIALTCTAAAALLLLTYERRVWRLRREHAVQKAFSQRLIDSQERERRRISYEMHDSLGHDLNVIKVRARLSKEKLTGNEAVRAELDEIGAIAEKSCGEIKEIAYDLRPYQLDKIGLSKTIEGTVRRVGRASGIEFSTQIANIDDLFEPDSQIHIYRIVQESVSNIMKHSKARRAKVTIERRAGSVELRIEDDGRGFRLEPSDLVDPMTKAFGVMGIRERAKILGGEVAIHSQYGQGTAVVVRFNVEDQRHGR